jgi:hypothetical protein
LDEGEDFVAKDKAHSRHLDLDVDWYIYPEGRALQTGDGCYFSIPTATYPLNMFSDFTVEFWFRTQADGQTAQTVFSSDRASIGMNSDGCLVLHTAADDYVLTRETVSDALWYHIALSVRRGGSVTVYVDGESRAQFAEGLLGDFSSGQFYFGAKRTPPNTFTEYFDGYFDEIRIWNGALNRETIVLNKSSKLSGDETGLLAYYPFETYVKNSNGTTTVTATTYNMLDGSMRALQSCVAMEPAKGVPVKDVRPVEDVPFTFVASNNKIMFYIADDYLTRVEGTTLTVTVDGVRDERDNRCNAEQWTAFVRLNPLQWDSEPAYVRQEEGGRTVFTAWIANNGGRMLNYVIGDIPSWLTVSGASGSLQPVSRREITLTVAAGVNIGAYEASLSLSSGNGMTEKLPVQLKVTAQKPDWKVNPNDFESSMNIIGRVQIDGVNQDDSEDILAGFIGDVCVMLASPEHINGAYYVFATVYGGASFSNQALTFRLWDASTGRIYPVLDATIDGTATDIRFTSSRVVGTASQPVTFNTQDLTQQTIAMKAGWNWISTNVASASPTILDQMKASLDDTGELIKGRTQFIQKPAWMGTLKSIEATTMYSVKVTGNHSLVLTGAAVNPATTDITVSAGWNWIGYTPQFTLPVSSALAGIPAREGDQIKGQTAFATCLGNGVWIGSLTFMQPGAGYMYYSTATAPQTFNYPSIAPIQRLSAGVASSSTLSTETDFGRLKSSLVENNPAANYPANMTMTAIVVAGEELRSAELELAAFSAGECRGAAMLQYVASLNRYIGFLTISGDSDEPVTFRVFDHATGADCDAENDALSFAPNAIFGAPTSPYIIRLGSDGKPGDGLTGTEINLAYELEVYPNPVRDELHITHPHESLDLIEIFDAAGRTVIRTANFTEATIPVGSLAPGVYMLRAVKEGHVTVKRFVKE